MLAYVMINYPSEAPAWCFHKKWGIEIEKRYEDNKVEKWEEDTAYGTFGKKSL